MPELPDITVYVEALESPSRRCAARRGATQEPISPSQCRSTDLDGEGASRHGSPPLGKRIVFALDDDLYIVLHLMIAGRLKWREAGKKSAGKIDLAAFDFSTGTLLLTEAGTKKRASLHLVRGADALAQLRPRRSRGARRRRSTSSPRA